MNRPVVDSVEGARADLGFTRKWPSWLAAQPTLPFASLSPDEFEVFSYFLLCRESPGERIFYYGKTGDGGRDILRPTSPQGCELIQCKHYQDNVGIGEIRKELAKLCANVFLEMIPDRPDRVTFYVSRDLTAPAKDLLRFQSRWLAEAQDALREHLGHEPEPALLEFARNWWPDFEWQSEIELTQRARRQQELLDEFFEVRGRIDGTIADVRIVVREELAASKDNPQSIDLTWEGFFRAVGQEDLAYFYLRDWPGLPPDRRFLAPEDFEKIGEAVGNQPLTLLIGPPAAGKTFLAVQLLWEAFLGNLKVRWISPATLLPTEGLIPSERGPDMKQRIEILTTKLGTKSTRAPLDHHDFIAMNLEPGSLVYIEDPFGKTDEEFEYSLHSYKFFDLDQFVAAISEGAARAGCHLLLSSREGLFDRWRAERAMRGLPPIRARLIHLSGNSYSYQRLESLALRLAQARGLRNPDDVAFEISTLVDLPYEIESIVRGLPLDADGERAVAEADKYRDGLKSALRRILVAETEPEALFLIVLASGCPDPKTRYLRLHRALSLPGEAEIALNLGIERYRAFVVRRPVTFRLKGYGPDADEVFFPSHSVIKEAITEYFRASPATPSPFLDRLACALPKDAADRKAVGGGAKIALFLLSLGTGCQPGLAEDAVLEVLLDRGGLSFDHARGLMRLWGTFGAGFRERLFEHLKSGLKRASGEPARSLRELRGNTRLLLIEMASTLVSLELPARDAWRFTRLLFRVFPESDGRGLYTWESPWSYLFEHLEEAPADILRALDAIATKSPDAFVYVLGEVAVAHWEKLSTVQQAAFFAKSSLRRPRVMAKALEGIARNWEKTPGELREFFERQASSDDPEIRAAAMTAAWIYRRHDNPVLDKVLVDAARDPDPKVPLQIMHSLGDEEGDRLFARAFFDRADEVQASEMIHDLLRVHGEPLPDWKADLTRDCLLKGGDRAWSTLALLHFREDEAATEPFQDWRAPISGQPEPIRLGALWAYGSSRGKRPALGEEGVVSLIEGLTDPFRSLALAYLSAQVEHLPESVRRYLESLEGTEGRDGDAVRSGKEKLDSGEGNNPWRFLPSPLQGSRGELHDVFLGLKPQATCLRPFGPEDRLAAGDSCRTVIDPDPCGAEVQR
jgi:hypothetical protein